MDAFAQKGTAMAKTAKSSFNTIIVSTTKRM